MHPLIVIKRYHEGNAKRARRVEMNICKIKKNFCPTHKRNTNKLKEHSAQVLEQLQPSYTIGSSVN